MKAILLALLSVIIWGSPDEDWDYQFQGDNWATNLCANGLNQNPINIHSHLIFAYDEKTVMGYHYDILNDTNCNVTDDKYMKITRKEGAIGKMEINGLPEHPGKIIAELKNFHFHTPSEHLMDGRRFDIEMHILHEIIESNEGDKHKYLIFSIFFDENAKNTSDTIEFVKLGKLNAFYTGEVGRGSVDLNILFESFSDQVRKDEIIYMSGSTTTPSCEENAMWLVYRTPLPLGAGYKSFLKHTSPGSYRNIKPGRKDKMYQISDLTLAEYRNYFKIEEDSVSRQGLFGLLLLAAALPSILL